MCRFRILQRKLSGMAEWELVGEGGGRKCDPSKAGVEKCCLSKALKPGGMGRVVLSRTGQSAE